MTMKEKGTELYEIFSFKYALTQKINDNRKLIIKADKFGEKQLAKIWREYLRVQISDRTKLALPKIAKQLGMKITTVKTEWNHFVLRKTEKSLSFKEHQQVLIAANRKNETKWTVNF